MEQDQSIGNDVTLSGGGTAVMARIDQYEIYRKLGGGGFGSVYFAKDTVAGIDVAVKGLPPVVKNNTEELERIRENFALVSRLHHPYIAAALHLQKARDVAYNDMSVRDGLNVAAGDTLMVMEYAPGVTLTQWTKQFPGRVVPVEKAVGIVTQIAEGLDYAHSKHILHRDIKPSNVMIETSPDGEVTARLLDFGLAAEIRSSMGRVSREVHDTSGTRPYMAPEQWAGEKQGPATDQYALAVVFCELVTGEVPFASVFECGDPVIMMTAVCNREAKLPGECPFRGVLLKALAKQPDARFDSCADFVSRLKRTEEKRGAPVSQASRDTRPRDPSSSPSLDVGMPGRLPPGYAPDASGGRHPTRVPLPSRSGKNSSLSRDDVNKLVDLYDKNTHPRSLFAKLGNAIGLAKRRLANGFRLLKRHLVRIVIALASVAALWLIGAWWINRVPANYSEWTWRGGVTQAEMNALGHFRAGDYLLGFSIADKLDSENPEVLYYLGVCYESVRDPVDGVEKDDEKAFSCYKRSAERNFAPALVNLCQMYALGRGCEKDIAAAEQACKSALGMKYPRAYDVMAMNYRFGLWAQKDVKRAVKYYKLAADAGVIKSRYSLFEIYSDGTGVGKNSALAFKYLKQAADNGYLPAVVKLAASYSVDKNGMPKDYVAAERLLQQAMARDYPPAFRVMGYVYLMSPDHSSERSKATEYLEMAVKKGDASAAESLGTIYELGITDKGIHIPKDLRKALTWYRKATELDPRLQHRVDNVKKTMLREGYSSDDLLSEEEKAAARAEDARRAKEALDAQQRLEKARQDAQVAEIEDATRSSRRRRAMAEKADQEKLEAAKQAEIAKREQERAAAEREARLVRCDRCNGTGKLHQRTKCLACSGAQFIEQESDCATCKGSGTVKYKVTCSKCSGKGTSKIKCSSCGGKGATKCSTCNGNGGTYERTYRAGIEGRNISLRKHKVACSSCNGKGSQNCYYCNGSGSEGTGDCSTCGGTGYLISQYACPKCNGRRVCANKVKCENCTGGFVESDLTCDKCNGVGKIDKDVKPDDKSVAVANDNLEYAQEALRAFSFDVTKHFVIQSSLRRRMSQVYVTDDFWKEATAAKLRGDVLAAYSALAGKRFDVMPDKPAVDRIFKSVRSRKIKVAITFKDRSESLACFRLAKDSDGGRKYSTLDESLHDDIDDKQQVLQVVIHNDDRYLTTSTFYYGLTNLFYGQNGYNEAFDQIEKKRKNNLITQADFDAKLDALNRKLFSTIDRKVKDS